MTPGVNLPRCLPVLYTTSKRPACSSTHQPLQSDEKKKKKKKNKKKKKKKQTKMLFELSLLFFSVEDEVTRLPSTNRKYLFFADENNPRPQTAWRIQGGISQVSRPAERSSHVVKKKKTHSQKRESRLRKSTSSPNWDEKQLKGPPAIVVRGADNARPSRKCPRKSSSRTEERANS